MNIVDELFDMPEPQKLMIAGDWHGNANWIFRAMGHARKAKCDTIIQLGDFGYWPRQFPGLYRGIVDYLRTVGDLKLYWVDGNHEDHLVLSGAEGLGNEVIRHLPRGHRWNWWGKTWMSVGGGVSVDKKWREPDVDWFLEETLTTAQLDYCMRDGDVDIIVAHDAPAESAIPGIHAKAKLGQEPSFFPAEQIAESWEHRELMSKIAKEKHPSFWFHGHYHHRYNDEVDGMRVVGLDCDGTHLNLNTVILTPQTLAGNTCAENQEEARLPVNPTEGIIDKL